MFCCRGHSLDLSGTYHEKPHSRSDYKDEPEPSWLLPLCLSHIRSSGSSPRHRMELHRFCALAPPPNVYTIALLALYPCRRLKKDVSTLRARIALMSRNHFFTLLWADFCPPNEGRSLSMPRPSGSGSNRKDGRVWVPSTEEHTHYQV